MSGAPPLEGGTTGGADDLYREVILDHFKSPRNKGRLETPTVRNEGVNPLCGDEVEITASLSDGRLWEIRFFGQGCAISQASASMMTELLTGKTLEEARALIARFKGLLLPAEPGAAPAGDTDDLGDLIALEGVKKYAARVKCATLAWNTLAEALPK